MEFIRPFAQIGREDAGSAGGKGASLGEMTQAGIPVPPGFVVLASTFERFIEETDLIVEIDAILDTVKHEEMHTVEHASEKIQALIHEATMPEDIATDILKHFKELGAEYVAVRSSATAEDSASAAWAGQLDTYLNTTEKEVLVNVQRCWASLFTPRAIFYRFEKGLNTQKISVAVVVQKMVNSDASGIAFSVHPVTEDRNQLIIEAGWGLGEAIVSGQVTPDAYVVTKEPREILDKNVATKERGMYRIEGGGSDWQPIPAAKQEQQTLTDEQIFALTETILGIEKHYGFPCDIEWAMEADVIYITQSRPITTLAPSFSEAPSEMPAGGANLVKDYALGKSTWTYKGFHGVLHTFFPVGETAYAMKGFFGDAAKQALFFVKDDYVHWYWNDDELTRLREEFLSRLTADDQYLEKLKQKWQGKIEAFESILRRIDSTDLSSLSDEGLANLYDEFYAAYVGQFSYFMALGDAVSMHADRYLTPEFEAVLGKDSVETLPKLLTTKYLSFIEEECFAREKLTEDFKNGSLDRKELEAHADEFFYIRNNYAKAARLSADDFEKMIKEDVEKEVALAEDTRDARLAVRDSLADKYDLSPRLRMLLYVMDEFFHIQDTRKKYVLVSNYYQFEFLREAERRTGTSFKLLQYSIYPEFRSVLAKEIDTDMLARRHELCAVVYTEADYAVFDGAPAEAALSHFQRGDGEQTEIKGMIASTGKAQGRVRKVLKIHDMANMEKGDVLVSSMTRPEMVPAMKIACAIVTDEGGVTSHAAIVSRELAIPCIIGTKKATQLLNDGDVVEVDATTGIVRLIKSAAPPSFSAAPSDTTGGASLPEPFAHAWDAGHWAQIGRWMQTPFTYSFFMEWGDLPPAERLYPGHAFTTVFSVDGYFHAAKEDLQFMTDELVRRHEDGTLAEYVQTFDDIGEELFIRYRSFIDSGFAQKKTIREAIELHKELNSYWSFITFVGDAVNEAVLRCKVAPSEAEFFDMVHPHLRISWIEDEEKRVRQMAELLVGAHIHTVTPETLDAAAATMPLLGEALSSYRATYPWLGINKWESEPNSPEQFAERLNQAIKNTLEGNYVESHAPSGKDLVIEPMIRISTSTAYGRATCSGFAEELAFNMRRRLTDLVRPYGLGYEDALLFSCNEIVDLDEKGELPVSPEELKKRREGFAMFYEPGHSLTTLTSRDEAYAKLRAMYAKPPVSDSDVLKGVTARKGVIRGRVCVVTGNADFQKFQAGDILVAPETTPSYVPLMRKASAILTERGGITSHAAIVSRELGVPCIISITGLISKLKDGDMVEVDADNGAVHIFESNSSSPTLIDGKDWKLTVSRNASFWHVVASARGSWFNTKDFGVSVPSIWLFVTVNGTETHIFMHPENLKAYNDAVAEAFSTKAKIKEIRKRYETFAEDVVDALKAADKKLTPKTWERFMDAYQLFTAGLMITSSYGRNGVELLSDLLRAKGVEETELPHLVSVMTYPPEHTPLFDSQLTLMRIGKDVQAGKISDADVEKRLSEWVEEFGCIPVNYCEDPWTLANARAQLAAVLEKDCAKELELSKAEHDRKAEEGAALVKKFSDSQIEIVAHGLAEATYLNEFRKNVFCRLSLEVRGIFAKIANLGGSENWRDCFYLFPEEIAALVSGEKLDIPGIVRSRRVAGIYFNTKEEEVVLDEATLSGLEGYINGLHGATPVAAGDGVTEVKGFSANKGKVQGVARIILGSKDFARLNTGEILVTTMTSVDFVPVMQKAAAFVTNEGGITSHAAIVAREMNKPCVIGTKNATQVIRDGDMVEVDANAGVVRKIG